MARHVSAEEVAAFRERFLVRKTASCTEEEIAQVEEAAGFPLPEEYKIFLRWHGRRPPSGMGDWDVTWEEAIEANKRIKKDYSAFFTFPERSFIFADRNGDAVRFFKDEGDNPPIYGWIGDSGPEPQKVSESIWHFLMACHRHR